MIRATSLCAEAERVTQSIESDAPPIASKQKAKASGTALGKSISEEAGTRPQARHTLHS